MVLCDALQITGNAVLEEPEEQTSAVEEEALCGEGEAPAGDQESMQDDALPAEQEQTSPVVAAGVDEQISIAEEPLSSQEQASPTKDETPLVEEEKEEEEVEVVEPSPVMGEALAAEQDSSVNEDTPVDPGEDTIDHQKAPELHEPAPEVADSAVLVPDKVMPEDEEGMEEKIGTEAAPFEKVDSPSPPLDKDTVDLSQDAVLLVGLKEVTYHLNGDNENDPTAEEVEKMDEEVPKEDEAEQGKETEEEKTEEEKATTTEEDEDGETVEQSSDNASDPPVVAMNVLRRKTKVSLATPKRKSTRLNKGPLEDEQPSELEDESTEKEEEKATTTEEELVEKSSDEAEETAIVDRRVLRRKTKVIQSPSKPRVKRRTNL